MTPGDAEWDFDSSKQPPLWSNELRALGGSFPLVRELVVRDLKVRYRRSWLGMVWAMLIPIAMLMVLSVVFSHLLAPRGVSYPVYLFPGLVFWTFFAQSSSAIAGSLATDADLFRRVRMSKTAPALANVAAGAVQLCVGSIACSAFAFGLGVRPSASLVTLPVTIVLAALLTLGCGLLVAAASTIAADAPRLFTALLPVLMFATPIVYPSSLLPPRVASALAWNPLAILLELYRAPFTGAGVSAGQFLNATLLATVTVVAGWAAFCRRVDDVVYRT